MNDANTDDQVLTSSPIISPKSKNDYIPLIQDGGACVMGFEVPRSPESSYNNPVPGSEDDARDPPIAPPHLQHTLLSYSASQEGSSSLPSPQNVILNHLYIENRESPRSVVALGITHRFRSKFVTVILYKPVQRR